MLDKIYLQRFIFLIIMKYILFIICVSSLLFCQGQKDKYVINPLVKGLPAEIPLKWENSFYSPINSGKFFNSIYLVSRDSLKRANNCFLFIVTSDGFSFSAVNFKNAGENIYKTKISLKTKDEDKLSPLKLLLNLNTKTIGFIWGEKNEKPTIIEEYNLKIGDIFPQVEVKTEDGNWTNKNDHKIIVINWWSTSCLPCIEEMPGLNALTKIFPKKDVEFIAIVWDKENLLKFTEKHKFNYKQGYASKTLAELLGEVFPRNIIINRDGKILFNKLGGSINIDKELEKIIRENI